MLFFSLEYIGTSKEKVNCEEKSAVDVIRMSCANFKRFSYPKPSNHCRTCSCQDIILTDALLLTRGNKRPSEEIFEQESAKKNLALTETAFQIKSTNAKNPVSDERKLILVTGNCVSF